MITKISGLLKFLLGRHSARNAAIITTILSMAGKVLGYARVCLVAYFFGASSFVDAYYVTYGAIFFIVITIQGTIEAAVVPKLIQCDEETAKNLLGWVIRALIIFMFILSILLLIFPEQYIHIFASTFDKERLNLAGNMVKWILPFAMSSLAIAVLSMWGNYRGRFAVSSTVLFFSNIISIPTLFILYPIIGNYTLPAFQSFSFSCLALCMWFILRDIPLYPQKKIPGSLLIKTGTNILYCLAVTGASFIYTLVDRYFASSLPVGNVSALSYAQLIFTQPMGLMAATFSIYLIRASESVKLKEEGEKQLFTALHIAWTYLFPPAVLLSILAGPVIKVLLGYGAFDAKAVALTTPCLAVAALGLPILLWNVIMCRYAQALGKLRLLAFWSYIGLIGNYFLDWLMVEPFGAPGLSAATTVMLSISTVAFMVILIPNVIKALCKGLFVQTMIVLLWSVPLIFIAGDGTFIPLAAGSFFWLAHIFICEKLGLYYDIPNHWRPMTIIRGGCRSLSELITR